MDEIKEIRREIAEGFELILKGKGIGFEEAALAEVIIKMAYEAGGKLRIDMKDTDMLDEILARLEAMGVDPETGQENF